MNPHWPNALFATVIYFMLLSCSAAEAGVISGTVESVSGEPTSGAIVLITEAELGLPLSSDGTTSPKFGRGNSYPLSVQTGPAGKFALEVPDGTYNLFAQSWQGTLLPMKGIPIGDIKSFSDTVSAEGRVAEIAVPSKQALDVRLKPAGSGTVQLRFDSANDASLAVVSTAPPALDPVLGFAGWVGDFLDNAVAINRVPKGRTDFHNLPAGSIYIAVFANDNKPGFGVSHVELKDGQTTTVGMKLVADWSNGRKTPPAELAELYQKFEENKWSLKDLPSLPKIPFQRTMPLPVGTRQVLVDFNPTVTLPDGSTASAKDVWTVLLYRRLADDS